MPNDCPPAVCSDNIFNDFVTCENTDGAQDNDALGSCKCGSATCDSQSGTFCLESNDVCSNKGFEFCKNTDGSEINIDACKCNYENYDFNLHQQLVCGPSNGQYCNVNKNACSAVPTP